MRVREVVPSFIYIVALFLAEFPVYKNYKGYNHHIIIYSVPFPYFMARVGLAELHFGNSQNGCSINNSSTKTASSWGSKEIQIAFHNATHNFINHQCDIKIFFQTLISNFRVQFLSKSLHEAM